MDLPRPQLALPVGPIKPKLRGVSHQYAFFVSLGCGVALILAASDGRARLAASVYAVAVSALLGTSALYHRVTWRPNARRWMRRLDHSMIFVLIAGTYTPVALLALKGSLASTILIVLWAGRSAAWSSSCCGSTRRSGCSRVCMWRSAWCRRRSSASCPQRSAGSASRDLPAGGLLYVIGAIVYASGRPNPWPKVFGYHEIFHALVIAAAALQYAVIAFAVLPHG